MTLKLVEPASPDPWSQQVGEVEEEYLLFLGWLHSDKPRSSPDYPGIAMHRNWAARANAFDEQSNLPTQSKDLLAQALADALTFSAVEIRKWARRTLMAGGETNVATIREIVTVLNMLTENKEQLKAVLEGENDDLEDLTDEQLRAVLEAKKAIATLGKKKR